MDRASLRNLISAAGLDARRDTILGHVLPGFELRQVEGSPGLGATKLGGHPDLPAEQPWPVDGARTLCFVGQLDLAEFAGRPGAERWPSDGLLLCFEGIHMEPPLGRVVYVPAGASLARRAPPDGASMLPDDPEGFDMFCVYPEAAMALSERLSLPPPWSAHCQALEKALGDDAFTLYWDEVWLPSVDTIEDDVHRALGYTTTQDDSDAHQLGLTLVLEVASDDALEMMWGDVGRLWFFVPDADLIAGRTDRATVGHTLT